MGKNLPRSLDSIILRLLARRLLLPLLIVTLLAIGWGAYLRARDIENQQLRLAQSVALTIEDHIAHAIMMLGTVANVAESASLNEFEIYVQAIWKDYMYFDVLQRLDQRGVIVLHLPAKAQYAGLDMSNQLYFEQTRVRNEMVISEPFISLQTGQLTVFVTWPLADGGMIVGELNLSKLQEAIVASLDDPDRGTVFVADKAGNLLAHPKFDLVAQQTNISERSIIQRGLKGETKAYYVSNNKLVLGQTSLVPTTNWIIVTELPLSVAYGPNLWTAGLIFTCSVVIWLLLAWNVRQQLEQQIVMPLRRLGQKAKAIAAGHFSHSDPGGITPFAEMKEMISNFSSMSRAIETRQTALEESEAKYRSLIENSNDAIYIIYGLQFELVNHKFTEMFGVTQEQVCTPDFDMMDLVAPSSRPLIQERWMKMSGGESVLPRYEFTAMTLDGREFEVEVSTSQIPYKDGTASQGILRDITERKRTQEAVRRNEERFRLMAENIQDGLSIFEHNKLVYINDRGCEIYGYTRDDLAAWPDLELVAPGEMKRLGETWNAVMEPESDVSELEFWIVQKDGMRRYVHNHYSNVRLSDGSLRRYIVTTDITEREQLEQSLRQAAKMEAVGRLAGGIAHDFNNLLTAIIGYTELLLGEFNTTHPVYADLNEIKKAADRATKLTAQLLAFGRKQVLRPQVLNLNHVITNIENMLRRLIGEHIELVTILDPTIGQIEADPGQIDQVIVNLAVNARDAMPTGGRLTIETRDTYLDQAYARQHIEVEPGSYVLIAISDTGIGIDEHIRPHLFEPFFTTKDVGQGTGLGLATSHGIIKQHGGHIAVYSEPGRGTTFNVYLPRTDPLSPSNTTETEASRPSGGAETILLVEDEDMVRALAQRILAQNGYTVLQAHHPHEALRICEQHQDPIHLVLTDVVMPAMSGQELFERLSVQRPGIKVLYMSGYTNNSMTDYDALDSEKAFLQKPFAPSDLARQVRNVLDNLPK